MYSSAFALGRHIRHAMGRHVPPQKSPSHGATWPPSITWFLGPTWVSHLNGISIGSAVFAQLTHVPNTHKDYVTCDFRRVHAMQPKTETVLLYIINKLHKILSLFIFCNLYSYCSLFRWHSMDLSELLTWIEVNFQSDRGRSIWFRLSDNLYSLVCK